MKFTFLNPCLGPAVVLSVFLTFFMEKSRTPYHTAYYQERTSIVPGLGSPKVHKITENVYAVTDLYHSAGGGFGTNAGIIFTSRSVVFIDAGMSIASGEFLWRVAEQRMKGDEDLYLFITHHHADHVFGMRVMKEKGAKVIGHRELGAWFLRLNGAQYKEFLAQRAGWSSVKRDKIFGDVVLTSPDQGIEKDTVLTMDGEEIHVLFTPGHVSDELSVYHPKSRTLFAGDTIYEGTDLTTRFGGPNEWREWISQLERLGDLEIETIVPGHGKLCSKKEINRNIAYLRKILK